MSPNVYILIGDSNTKKSSTVRALTGAYKKGKWQIETRNGMADFYIQISALQESQISPKEFIRTIRSSGRRNLLLTLRIQRFRSQPDALGYMKQFKDAGWRIRDIIVLGAKRTELPFSLPFNCDCIVKSRKMTANSIANDIRHRWKWK